MRFIQRRSRCRARADITNQNDRPERILVDKYMMTEEVP